MDQSFIDIHKLNEYYGHTLAFLQGELKYIRSFDIVDSEEEGRDWVSNEYDEYDSDYRYFVIVNATDKNNSTKSYYYSVNHYDDMLEYIKSWFPPAFYCVSNIENKTLMFRLAQSNHWKRSADSDRYQAVQPRIGDLNYYPMYITNFWNWNIVDRSIDEAISECVETGEIAAVNDEFAVGEYAGKLVLFYLESAIGKINDDMSVSIHPKYYSHFRGRVAKIARVNAYAA